MSRYIIEINPEYEDKFRGVMILGAENSNLYVDSQTVDELEELNSDYINEHYGDLQDDAYHRGLAEGKKAFDLLDAERDAEYQRGLEDAWNVARKIAVETDDGGVSISALYKIFGTESMCMIMKNNTVYDVTDKLKAYEEKQKQTDDEIKVGDIVERYLNGKLDSTGIYLGEDGDYWNCLFWTGAVFGTFAYPKNQFKKTEKHVDIDKILEGLRYDS